MQIFFWIFGLLGILLFHLGVSVPIFVSVLVFIVAGVFLVQMFRNKKIGYLPLFLFFVYALPFIHISSYLGFNFDAPPPTTMWGLLVNPYTTQKPIVELMSMIGAVGAAGFVIGAFLARGKFVMRPAEQQGQEYHPLGRTLPLPLFFCWILAAVVLTWISAPQQNIFLGTHTQLKSLNDSWDFSSAWLISYAFILFSLADSLFETSKWKGRLKRQIVLIAFFIIVVWFQLLRGQRNCLPCVIAVGLMYFVWGKGLPGTKSWINKIKGPVIGMSVAGIFLISLFLGRLRTCLVGVTSVHDFWAKVLDQVHSGLFNPENLFCGTWSSVLLSPLSIAGDYINGVLPFDGGKTYSDLLASLIPGFLADWIGYIRPIDGLHSPAWEMTYGEGGTHAVVVPFLNYRMAGVFIIIALWSYLFVKIERKAFYRLTVSWLALLGMIATAAPHWLWYGEKNIMNALIIWLVLSVAYRIQIVR